jgi:hypothetical protein
MKAGFRTQSANAARNCGSSSNRQLADSIAVNQIRQEGKNISAGVITWELVLE